MLNTAELVEHFTKYIYFVLLLYTAWAQRGKLFRLGSVCFARGSPRLQTSQAHLAGPCRCHEQKVPELRMGRTQAKGFDFAKDLFSYALNPELQGNKMQGKIQGWRREVSEPAVREMSPFSTSHQPKLADKSKQWVFWTFLPSHLLRKRVYSVLKESENISGQSDCRIPHGHIGYMVRKPSPGRPSETRCIEFVSKVKRSAGFPRLRSSRTAEGDHPYENKWVVTLMHEGHWQKFQNLILRLPYIAMLVWDCKQIEASLKAQDTPYISNLYNSRHYSEEDGTITGSSGKSGIGRPLTIYKKTKKHPGLFSQSTPANVGPQWYPVLVVHWWTGKQDGKEGLQVNIYIKWLRLGTRIEVVQFMPYSNSSRLCSTVFFRRCKAKFRKSIA